MSGATGLWLREHGMHEHPGTWFNAVEALLPEQLHHYISVGTLASWTVILLLLVLVWFGTRRLTQVPRGLQNFWEWIYEVFAGFSINVLGPDGKRYMPLLATSFIYIFSMNLFGIVPGFLAPTTSLNMTIALALVVFFAVQYYGFQAHGLAYLKHFANPIHIVSEIAKPLSLSVRLFGNIFGEDTVLAELLNLAGGIFNAIHVPIPFHLVMVAFAIFGSFIQALIFTMLTAVYLALAIEGEHAPTHGSDEQDDAETLVVAQ